MATMTVGDEMLGVLQTLDATLDPPSLAAPSARVRARAADREPGAVVPGDKLDHFTIERELGRGGMGIVYVAHDRALDRRVALKVVTPKRGDQLAVERLFREARAQARLASPYVVPIHFVGRAGAAAYFAMELVAGESLEAVLDRGERLDPEHARILMNEVAKGLASAHAAGFIHRDIKPSNLLLGLDGHVKIADFGLAKPVGASPVSTLTRDGVVLGTPMYMAPEQTRADGVDHRADMYALGCSFFHLLTGEPPYDAENAVELLSKHFTAPVPSVRSRVRDVPLPLATIVERLMQKEPEERFASYDDLVRALDAAGAVGDEPAGFAIRAAAVAIDLAIAATIVEVAGPIAAAVYFAAIAVVQSLRGQTPGKYLVRIRAERAAGTRLGLVRGLARFAIAAWLPVLVSIMVLATRGHEDLLAIIDRASEIEQMKTLVTAFALGNAALSIVYVACLGLAAVHPDKRAVHDLLSGSRVVHVRSGPRAIPL